MSITKNMHGDSCLKMDLLVVMRMSEQRHVGCEEKISLNWDGYICIQPDMTSQITLPNISSDKNSAEKHRRKNFGQLFPISAEKNSAGKNFGGIKFGQRFQ